MSSMPGPLDFAFIALFTVGMALWEGFVGWPRLRSALEADKPGARLGAYRFVMAYLWLFALIAIALWVSAHRPWSALGLTSVRGWRLAVSVIVVAAPTILFVRQVQTLAKLSDARRAALRPRLGVMQNLSPHTREERDWFMGLSITAGVCEELLFRGFLMWAFRPWLGIYGAAAGSAVLFAIGHAYQGRDGVARVALMGAAFSALALVTGSIIPGIVAHAILDIGGGMTGYTLLREGEEA